VLAGAQRLFETVRPFLLCEVIPSTAPAVTEFLESHGYQIFDGEIPRSRRQPVLVAPWSTVAIPM